ncbi:MAG: sodium:proton antiporter [Caldilineaceae bacterium]|nr:sodium:proton antiporter [Caldilineaceae bacterium]
MEILVAFVLLVIVYGFVSQLLANHNITPHMVFVSAGILVAFITLRDQQFALETEIFILTGEVALALILFGDASRIRLHALRSAADLPGRLLLIGLPLTILLGTVVAAIILPQLSIWEAAILASVLSPTDAGLGQAVVSDKRLPVRIRQALNIESGLNDGLSTPIFMILVALVTAEQSLQSPGQWLNFIVSQIGIGAGFGILMGVIGGRLFTEAGKRQWVSQTFTSLMFPALALFTWYVADEIGGNGFIAAFCGGLTIAVVMRNITEEERDFGEVTGQWVSLLVFFLFGAVAFPLLGQITWQICVYALLSLTIIRMLPVAVSLMGEHLNRATVLFLGWFGPRGLASIVLGLILLREIAPEDQPVELQLAIITTVLFSVFLHGISANPLVARYTKSIQALHHTSPELSESVEMPNRQGF